MRGVPRGPTPESFIKREPVAEQHNIVKMLIASMVVVVVRIELEDKGS